MEMRLKQLETATNPIERRHVLGCKSREECSNAKRPFSTLEISALVAWNLEISKLKLGNFHPSSFGCSFQHFKLIGLVKFVTR